MVAFFSQANGEEHCSKRRIRCVCYAHPVSTPSRREEEEEVVPAGLAEVGAAVVRGLEEAGSEAAAGLAAVGSAAAGLAGSAGEVAREVAAGEVGVGSVDWAEKVTAEGWGAAGSGAAVEGWVAGVVVDWVGEGTGSAAEEKAEGSGAVGSVAVEAAAQPTEKQSRAKEHSAVQIDENNTQSDMKQITGGERRHLRQAQPTASSFVSLQAVPRKLTACLLCEHVPRAPAALPEAQRGNSPP